MTKEEKTKDLLDSIVMTIKDSLMIKSLVTLVTMEELEQMHKHIIEVIDKFDSGVSDLTKIHKEHDEDFGPEYYTLSHALQFHQETKDAVEDAMVSKATVQ